jgi:predicted DNA-binding protein with PD1-like motif
MLLARAMIAFESQNVRRIVGRVGRGETLPDAFLRLAAEKGISAAWITALGAFEWVELMEYDQHEKKYLTPRRIGECEILNLTGNLSIRKGEVFAHIHGTVSKERADGIDVYGGHLVAGQVFACEFMLECFDDLVLTREYEDKTGLDLWAGEECCVPAQTTEDEAAGGGAAVAAKSPGELSWAQVAQVAQAAAPAQAYVEQMPLQGDYIEHKVFGLCRIDGRGTDGAFIIRLPNDPRRKKLSVEMFEFLGPRVEGNRRIFICRKR